MAAVFSFHLLFTLPPAIRRIPNHKRFGGLIFMRPVYMANQWDGDQLYYYYSLIEMILNK